jgi:hypothetical protein
VTRPHNPVIFGVGAIVYGLVLLCASPSDFRSPTFDLQFDVLPRQTWGLLFIAAGILAAVWPRWETAALLTATIGGWAIGLVRAVVTGVSTGPGGWVPWTMVIVALIASYVRHGVGDRR